MTIDGGKWLEISTFQHLSSLLTGWISAPSNDSANDYPPLSAVNHFLPFTFQAGDDQSSFKAAVMAETGFTQGLCVSSRPDGFAPSQMPDC